MKKIRLEIEALSVESFAPAEAPALRGTVNGLASLYWEDCAYETETRDGAHGCGPTEQSCGGTCYENTCHPGCGVGSAACSGGCTGVTHCYVGTTCIDMEG